MKQMDTGSEVAVMGATPTLSDLQQAKARVDQIRPQSEALFRRKKRSVLGKNRAIDPLSWAKFFREIPHPV
jgi:hypothetical protein